MKHHLLLLLLLNAFISQSIKAQSSKTSDSIRITLEKILDEDQALRKNMDSLMKVKGILPGQIDSFWLVITKADSLHAVAVGSIIQNFGWLSAQETSEKASDCLFAIIQHADLQIQKNYLPVLREAVSRGKAKKSYYAYLYDRIAMKSEKFQYYGTQLGGDYKGNLTIWPIKNAATVNVRRREYELNSIEEYAQHLRIKYVAPLNDTIPDCVLLTFFIYDERNLSIDSAEIISVADSSVLGVANSDGVVQIFAKKSLLNTQLLIRKKGFVNLIIEAVNDKTPDVYFFRYQLKENR